MIYCHIMGCKYNRGTPSEGIKFFLSPKDSAMRMKWKASIERHQKINDRFKLCELHFEENALLRNGAITKLEIDAVPTIFPTSTHPAPEPALFPGHNNHHDSLQAVEPDEQYTSRAPRNSEHNYCVKCLNLDAQLQKHNSRLDRQKKQITQLRMQISEAQNGSKKLNSKLTKQALEIQSLIQAHNQKDTECAVCEATRAPNYAHICNGDKELKCAYCHRHFASTAALMKHLHTSHPEKVFYKCGQCPKVYSMKLLLAEHRKSHSRPKVIDVDEVPSNKPAQDLPERLLKPSQSIDCGEIFTYPSEPHLHTSSKNSPPPDLLTDCPLRPFQCGECSKTFVSSSELGLHIRTEHTVRKKKITQFECYICKLQFESRKKLRAHLNISNRDNKCVVCLTKHTRREFEQHMCHGLETVQCEYCHENFSQMHSLLKHLQVCEGKILSHRCEKCGKLFAMALLRDLHTKSHQGDILNKYKCNICSKAFASDNYLQKHLKTHALSNEHLCDQCGKGFRMRSHLNYHKRIHGEKTFECTQCGKKFASSSQLKAHSYMHKDMKVVCSICNKALTNPQRLSVHMKIHTRREADRINQCTICLKRFFSKDHLSRHMRITHSSGHRYACEFCEQTFKYIGDLNKHKRQKHLIDNIYACNECSERFRQPYELERHKYKHYKPPNERMEN